MIFRLSVCLLFQLLTLSVMVYATECDKEFDLIITWGKQNPVGISKDSFLVNGQSPGPVIEFDEGDSVLVRVRNGSPFAITIHYHGLEMYGTPWADGVPGLTQRPIEPTESFDYIFRATQYGSYWYHGHYKGQLEDGLLGAIVIHPRENRPNVFHMISNNTDAILAMKTAEREVRPILITDWGSLSSTERWNITLASHVEISCYDALLLNGKGKIGCLGEDAIADSLTPAQKRNLNRVPGATFTDKGCLPPEAVALIPRTQKVALNASNIPTWVHHGCSPTEGSVEVIRSSQHLASNESWVALDIIAATSFIRAALSIDKHDMYVYAVDGSYIEPQMVQALDFTNGDRYSVLVKTDRPGAYKIRVSSKSNLQVITAYAILSVGDSNVGEVSDGPAYIDLVGEPTSKDVISFNPGEAKPFPRPEIAQSADELYVLNMYQDGATYLWSLNNTGLMPGEYEDESPILLDPGRGANTNVTITTLKGTWIDLVFITADIASPAHPIHKHGNKMYMIGMGTGPFEWASVDEAMKENSHLFNLANPLPRDTILTPVPFGELAWAVVRYHAANPGPWLMHCHINNHMMGGMSMIIQDGVDAWPDSPDDAD